MELLVNSCCSEFFSREKQEKIHSRVTTVYIHKILNSNEKEILVLKHNWCTGHVCLVLFSKSTVFFKYLEMREKIAHEFASNNYGLYFKFNTLSQFFSFYLGTSIQKSCYISSDKSNLYVKYDEFCSAQRLESVLKIFILTVILLAKQHLLADLLYFFSPLHLNRLPKIV